MHTRFLIALLACLAPFAWAAETDDALILHLPFAEGSGDTAADLSPHAATATITNADWTQDTLRGKPAVLHTTPETRIVVPYDPRFDLPEQLTLTAWVRLAAYPVDYARHLFQKWEFPPRLDNANYAWYIFGNHEGKNPAMEGRLALYGAPGGGEFAMLSPGVKLDLHRWYHVAATYHHERGGQLYINGLPIAEHPQNVTGRLATNDADLAFSWADGAIADLRIYNRQLANEEILDLVRDEISGAAILDDPLANLPGDDIASPETAATVTEGRLPGRQALTLTSGNLTWPIDADGPSYIELWVRPETWNAATASEIELATFTAGERSYRLYKPHDQQRLHLSSGGTILQVVPIYAWLPPTILRGPQVQREKWHCLHLIIRDAEVRLVVDGIGASQLATADHDGPLRQLTLSGQGTTFTELRVEAGELAGQELLERYLQIYRGDDPRLLGIR